MDFDQLDGYSRFAMRCILNRFPEWHGIMALNQQVGYEHPFLEITLNSPSPGIENGMWVSTADQEITVGIHTHHSHFNNFEDPTDWAHIDDALDHVQELLDERLVIVSQYVGDHLAVSSTQKTDTGEKRFSPIRNVTRTTIRSWLGTCDRDIEPEIGTWWKRLFR